MTPERSVLREERKTHFFSGAFAACCDPNRDENRPLDRLRSCAAGLPTACLLSTTLVVVGGVPLELARVVVVVGLWTTVLLLFNGVFALAGACSRIERLRDLVALGRRPAASAFKRGGPYLEMFEGSRVDTKRRRGVDWALTAIGALPSWARRPPDFSDGRAPSGSPWRHAEPELGLELEPEPEPDRRSPLRLLRTSGKADTRRTVLALPIDDPDTSSCSPRPCALLVGVRYT